MSYIIYSSKYFCFYCENKNTENKLPYISNFINVDKKAEYLFSVNNKNWSYKDYWNNKLLNLAIVFNDIDTFKIERYRDSNNLALEVNVYSKYKDTIFERLVYTKNYPSKKISFKTLNFSGTIVGVNGYTHTFRIGLINNLANEDIYIKLKVLNPDSTLNLTQPRLILFGEQGKRFDAGLVSTFVYFLLGVCFLCLLVFLIREIKKIVEKDNSLLNKL